MSYSVFILTLILNCALSKKLSPFVTCKRSSLDFDQCLTSAVNKALQELQNPLPEFGTPGLKVIHLGTVRTEATTNGNFRLDQELSNITIRNFANLHAVDTKLNIDGNSVTILITSEVTDYIFEANFHVRGQILIIPLDSKGKLSTNIVKGYTNTTVTGNIIEKDGQRYLSIVDLKNAVRPELVTIKVMNIFKNEQLENTLNRLLNENWKEVYEELGDGYLSAVELFFKAIAEKIFGKISFDNLFPD